MPTPPKGIAIQQKNPVRMNYLNEGIAQIKTLEAGRNCNEGIAKMVFHWSNGVMWLK